MSQRLGRPSQLKPLLRSSRNAPPRQERKLFSRAEAECFLGEKKGRSFRSDPQRSMTVRRSSLLPPAGPFLRLQACPWLDAVLAPVGKLPWPRLEVSPPWHTKTNGSGVKTTSPSGFGFCSVTHQFREMDLGIGSALSGSSRVRAEGPRSC